MDKKPSDFVLVGRYDYVEIANIHTYGDRYCGNKTGHKVYVDEDYAIVIFRSNSDVAEIGFLLLFTAVPIGKCKQKTDYTVQCVRKIAVFLVVFNQH